MMCCDWLRWVGCGLDRLKMRVTGDWRLVAGFGEILVLVLVDRWEDGKF